jgi:hypothetical protein
VGSDTLPPGCETIEVRVAELHQMLHAIDASPYRGRQLDPGVEEFIVNRADDLSGTASIGLIVHVDRAPTEDEAADLRTGIPEFFARRATATRRELRGLLRRGRISLVIGIAFLGALSGLAQALTVTAPSGFARIVRESLIIGGWVAMWRPLEVFLYDWWPIWARARRYDRLAIMPISIRVARAGEVRRFTHPTT